MDENKAGSGKEVTEAGKMQEENHYYHYDSLTDMKKNELLNETIHPTSPLLIGLNSQTPTTAGTTSSQGNIL